MRSVTENTVCAQCLDRTDSARDEGRVGRRQWLKQKAERRHRGYIGTSRSCVSNCVEVWARNPFAERYGTEYEERYDKVKEVGAHRSQQTGKVHAQEVSALMPHACVSCT